jgi:hypothetical protein
VGCDCYPRSVKRKESTSATDEAGKLFVYLTAEGRFYYNHGKAWDGIKDERVRQILEMDYGICDSKDSDAATRFMRQTMRDRQVYLAVDVAGYSAGVHLDTKERPFLVMQSTPLITPVKGEWRLIKKILTNMLREQLKYFHCWMKWAMESLRDQTRAPGHYLIIMGPPGCGKTLAQEKIIRRCSDADRPIVSTT